MRIAKIFIVIAVITNIMLANNCFAGAWTERKGKMYEKVSLNYYTEDQFSDINISNYLEYGLTDTLSIVNSIYYKWLRNHTTSTVYDNTSVTPAYVTTDTTATNNGFGDIDLGLKHKLMDGDYGVFSHKVTVKIPGPYNRNDTLPLGNGQFDLDYRVLYGYSLWKWIPGYVNFEAGYRFRFGGSSDQFRYGAEVGSDITTKIHARVKLDGALSMNNGHNGANTSLNPTIVNTAANQAVRAPIAPVGKSCGGNGAYSSVNPTADDTFILQTLKLELVYKFTDKWGLEFGYSPTLHTGDTNKGASYSGGVYYLLK